MSAAAREGAGPKFFGREGGGGGGRGREEEEEERGGGKEEEDFGADLIGEERKAVVGSARGYVLQGGQEGEKKSNIGGLLCVQGQAQRMSLSLPLYTQHAIQVYSRGISQKRISRKCFSD